MIVARPPRAVILLALALIPAAVLIGCETTRERSARLAKENKFQLADEESVNVTRKNRDVKVTEAKVLTDDFGQAAVVVVEVDADRPSLNVPIELTIEDSAGAQMFKNDTPGLDSALTGPAALPAKGEAFWVYDQLTLTGKPGEAKAEVGKGEPFVKGPLPEFEISRTELESDADGVLMAGTIAGDHKQTQRKLVIYGLARKRGKIVAAGTAQLEKLAVGRRARFQMFFVGDPSGADVSYFIPPTAVS
ncbi:MAG: hypothetical protein WAO61_00425 [Solirubrobacterales bacterium]